MTIVDIKRVKPKKRIKRSTLDNKALDIWRTIIKEYGRCEMCGKEAIRNDNDKVINMDAHHVITKSNYRLRWNIRNGVCLCAGCHTMRIDSAHKDSLGFAKWFETTRADDYEYVIRVKNEIWDKDYDKVYKYLQEVKKV